MRRGPGLRPGPRLVSGAGATSLRSYGKVQGCERAMVEVAGEVEELGRAVGPATRPAIGWSEPERLRVESSRPQLLQLVVHEQAALVAGDGCVGFRRAIGDDGKVAASPKCGAVWSSENEPVFLGP